jgi:hypothetical protein
VDLAGGDPMAQLCAPPTWTHRGCSVQLVGSPDQDDAFQIRHCSGAWLGTASSLDGARELIDARIVLLRQRLAARG